MSNDDVPLPTTNVRRRSIFDDHKDVQQQNYNTAINFPTERNEVTYPIEYIEKIRTETHLWKMHINKTLEELHKFKAERKELKHFTVDENILSTEQCDVLASFNFDEYMRRVQNFSNRATIIAHQIQYKSENDLANKLLAAQSKLEREIMKTHNLNGEV